VQLALESISDEKCKNIRRENENAMGHLGK
jgi:hypothetical protein